MGNFSYFVVAIFFALCVKAENFKVDDEPSTTESRPFILAAGSSTEEIDDKLIPTRDYINEVTSDSSEVPTEFVAFCYCLDEENCSEERIVNLETFDQAMKLSKNFSVLTNVPDCGLNEMLLEYSDPWELLEVRVFLNRSRQSDFLFRNF
jgi:hypothetical protein